MKFIYKLDSVMSPMCDSRDSYEMDFDDNYNYFPGEVYDSGLNSLVERTKLMEGLMTQLSTCPTFYVDTSETQFSDNKVVDTDELSSANAHYTLEDFFTNYSDDPKDETEDDISEADLDFSKMFGSSEDGPVDYPFESLIDLVNCEIPEVYSDEGLSYSKNEELPNPVVSFSPQRPVCKLVVKSEATHTRSRTRHKKAKSSASKTDRSSTSRIVEKRFVNNRKVDYGANDTIDNIYDLEWHPGFTRHLGAKGRSALLELVRKVYRQDPEHYKAILQSRSSSSSISSLPFYSIPMLWELAHRFGIFKQALTVYKTHCFSKSRSKFYGFNKGSQNGSSSDSTDNTESEKKEKREQSPIRGDPTLLPLTTMSGRLVKRSKKILEYIPDQVIDQFPTPAPVKSELDIDEDVQKPMSQLTLNHSINDEISDNLIVSPNRNISKSESLDVDSETPLMWNSIVANRSTNCVDEYKEGPLTPSHSLNRRISV